MRKLSISVGVFTYNEEQNVGRMLESLLAQEQKPITISEIIVISSGSTDKTDSIVKKFCAKHPHVRLYRQKKRLGKASAVNLFLSLAKEDIVVLSSADILLRNDTIEKLITPLRKPEVGIVGSHPVPLNDKKTFCGYASYLLWELHHKLSLRTPKMGECIAFRKIFKQIPTISAVDEANVEALIRGQGYRAVYANDAIVYNKGADTVSEYIHRRSAIFAGHLITKKEYGYEVSTVNGIKILYLLLSNVEYSWRFFLWTPIIIVLETYSRILGYLDYRFKIRSHTIWQITPSTKRLPQITQ